jgi:hypothetical protein
MTTAISNIVFDCTNALEVADFWSKAISYNLYEIDQDLAVVRHPDGIAPTLMFQNVAGPKTIKNRVHLEIETSDLMEEETRLTQLGAHRLWEIDENGFHWIVMADPEGNEFCLVLTNK